MKFSLLKCWAMWQRFRRTSPNGNAPHAPHAPCTAQIDALMREADPFAPWEERANWMIDIAEWLRRDPRESGLGHEARHRAKHQRTRFLLDWLDSHRDAKRIVQTTLQKTLRESAGPELFCATGLPREPAFFSELSERVIKRITPKSPVRMDLSGLFTAMFPEPADADWLLGLDYQTMIRLWKLCADDGIAHSYRQQIDEALTYLVSMIIAVGISSDFRQRLEPRIPLQATPFMALRHELQKYLMGNPQDEGSMRSVRMLIAVCQAQTDRIYAHLDEYGVSISLVYRVERMRAQLTRMARLIELRSALPSAQSAVHVQALLIDLIDAHHHRSSVRGLIGHSGSLLARKMVERNADHGEQYIAREAGDYPAMVKAAFLGGIVTAFTVLAKNAITGTGTARFFEGMLASLTYATSFLAISAIGGMLATKQPAVTAPVLASKMQALDTVEGLHKLLSEIACLLRSQAAAVFGNLTAVVPTIVLVSMLVLFLSGEPVMQSGKAHATVQAFSIWGATPLFAAFTGVLLWLSSLAAGFADNWFALRNMRAAVAHHRSLVRSLGRARAGRFAKWIEHHIASVAGNVSLAILLGMSPVIAQFFDLPLDVRHVTLSTGALAAAVTSLGWGALATPEFWLAAAGIGLIGVLNVGIAFGCALALALRARDVPLRVQRLVFRALLRKISASPRFFLFPEKSTTDAAAVPPVHEGPSAPEEDAKQAKSGS